MPPKGSTPFLRSDRHVGVRRSRKWRVESRKYRTPKPQVVKGSREKRGSLLSTFNFRLSTSSVLYSAQRRLSQPRGGFMRGSHTPERRSIVNVVGIHHRKTARRCYSCDRFLPPPAFPAFAFILRAVGDGRGHSLRYVRTAPGEDEPQAADWRRRRFDSRYSGRTDDQPPAQLHVYRPRLTVLFPCELAHLHSLRRFDPGGQ